MIKYDEDKFRKICLESASMSQAASKLGIHFNTFKRHAQKLRCYSPNQGLSGGKKDWKKSNIKTDDILKGKYPEYQTYKLKIRLLNEGVFENVCSICELTEWQDSPLNMELDHIDGNRTNHLKENLRMLCPNCHAQTETHRAKNKSLSREIC
jgi:hypothetical protein